MGEKTIPSGPSTDPAVLEGLERARQLYPERVVTHFRIGIWDVYEESHPDLMDSSELLLVYSMRGRWSRIIKNAPYFTRMIRDVLSIPGCAVQLGANTAIGFSVGVIPAISLWFEERIIRTMESALETGTVNATFLAQLCAGRVVCTLADMALKYAQTRLRNSLNGRIRRHFALKTFRAYARLDLPTYSRPATQMQLSGLSDDFMGQTSMWLVIQSITDIGSRLTQLASQSVVLWNALKSQRDGPLLAVVAMASEMVPFLCRMGPFSFFPPALAITTTNKDYMKMHAWKSVVRRTSYRKELVAGNLAGYATAEFKMASERVGDNDRPWQELASEGAALSWQMFVPRLCIHIPQVAFTLHSIYQPRFKLPVSLASFSLVQNAVRSFAMSMEMMLSYQTSLGHSLDAVRNMYEAENISNTVPDGTVAFPENPSQSHLGLAIEFRNVSFTYPDSYKYALQNASFCLSSGQLCVIIGTNGAGKSTILKLLVRLYDPDEGQIFVDGHDIRTLKLSDLREAVSILFQDYAYFPLSIRDNIALGDPTGEEAPEDRVRAAARLGGAEAFIDQLPHSFDTQLDRDQYGAEARFGPSAGHKTSKGRAFDVCAVQEAAGMFMTDSIELSGGQMQRLAVARSFMRSVVRKDNKIGLMLFDEPSASLDPAAEHDLFEKLRELKGSRTMIFSSHRFENLTRHADLIIYMDESGIVEQGTHDELLGKDGKYAGLWKMQARAFMD